MKKVWVNCEKEMGQWTIRVNGFYVGDFWREKIARRFAMNLASALSEGLDNDKIKE